MAAGDHARRKSSVTGARFQISRIPTEPIEVGSDPAEQQAARPLFELTRVLEEQYRDLAFHGRAVSGYSAMTARELGLDPETVERVALAGELHDVGKVGVDEEILLKPAALTDPEWRQIKQHPQIGADLLYLSNLDDLAHWVVAHHERPDGTGYPFGLSASEITLEAKILAVTDSYDAMRTDRVYKAGMNHRAAAAELREQSGSQFDPEVVDAFLCALERLGRGRFRGAADA